MRIVGKTINTKRVAAVAFAFVASFTLAAIPPASSVVQAQAVVADAVKERKGIIGAEIERRINAYNKTLESLKIKVNTSKTTLPKSNSDSAKKMTCTSMDTKTKTASCSIPAESSTGSSEKYACTNLDTKTKTASCSVLSDDSAKTGKQWACTNLDTTKKTVTCTIPPGTATNDSTVKCYESVKGVLTNKKSVACDGPSSVSAGEFMVCYGELKGEGTKEIPCPTAAGKLDVPTDGTISSKAKDTVKKYLEKAVQSLEDFKNKVEKATSLESLQELAKKIDAQLGINQLSQIAAAVTQAVESVSGVFENLSTTYENLNGQFLALKQCVKNIGNGESTATLTIDKNTFEVACDEFNVGTQQIEEQAQALLGSLATAVASVGAVMTSVAGLLTVAINSLTDLFANMFNNALDQAMDNLNELLATVGVEIVLKQDGKVASLSDIFASLSMQLDSATTMSSGSLGGIEDLIKLMNR